MITAVSTRVGSAAELQKVGKVVIDGGLTPSVTWNNHLGVQFSASPSISRVRFDRFHRVLLPKTHPCPNPS
jgi:hypothetical protein